MLAKALAKQLKRCMLSIISKEKGAFVGGRQVLDSVHIMLECIDSKH